MDSFGDGAGGAEEAESERAANDGGIFFKFIAKKLAVFKRKIEYFRKVWSGGDDGGGGYFVVFDGDGGLTDGEGSDGGDVVEFVDSCNVFEREVGFLVLGRGGEFVNNAADGIFARAGANDDKVSAGFFDLGGNKTVNAAGKRKNQDDRGDADGDAKSGEERTSAVTAQAAGSELDVGADE